MNIKNINIFDTHGELSEDLFKNHPDTSALSAWFTGTEENKILNFSTNNIRYASIPSINETTYLTFLTYNGSSGAPNRLFSTVVAEDSGVFDVNNVPVLQYSPNDMYEVVRDGNADTFKDMMLDIKMYNGSIDVLNYADTRMSHGPLSKYSKDYIVTSRRSFPTHVSALPNMEASRIFLDGWYSYTNILFRSLVDGDRVFKDSFYGSNGFIFKASDDGTYRNAEHGATIIVEGGTSVHQVSNTDYEEILFSLNEATGISPQSNNVYLHSQVLVLEEIRQAIIDEVVEAACNCDIGCQLMDWQQLTLNRVAAYVMFENGLFDKAQSIIESSRGMCCSTGINSLNSLC